ncbi:hypothetical protein [Brevibacterium linens]|uniref:AB hydrolase-1 domain-containing protein n=1 Tax=Brevibacterium linens TaxID=1703 RepID=A0A0B9ATS0_BRELN|nr:hypothetical protein [Brevibacterium linens]KHS52738.1 hypothetical protein AE0388_1721 [Brevibacterium linens]
MDTAIPLTSLDARGVNAPLIEIEEVGAAGLGASRQQVIVADGYPLDSLLVNKGSQTLVVLFHGATDRSRTVLPRFEWLSTVSALPVSSLYLSDPTLHTDPSLQLSWYTGWKTFNLHEYIASHLAVIAEQLGVTAIILAGSSGGGFACLQVSSYMPGSVAVAFNPQTNIAAYKVGGVGMGPQKYYARTVMPELVPLGVDNLESNPDWILPLEDRLSAIARYRLKRQNRLVIVQNQNEFHFPEHLLPFASSARNAGNSVDEILYEGPNAHVVPPRELLSKEIMHVVSDLPLGA